MRNAIGWIVFVTALATFAVFVLATLETGLRSDSPIANPNYPVSTPDSPLAPMASSAAQTAALFAVVLWLSWRQRRLHWAAIIAIAALFLSIADPPANWATFAVLDPSIPHFPLSWPYFRR